MRAKLQVGGQLTSAPLPSIELMAFGEGSIYVGLRVGPKYSDPVFDVGVQLEEAYGLETFIWRRPRLRARAR
jgi:hypothetical protein